MASKQAIPTAVRIETVWRRPLCPLARPGRIRPMCQPNSEVAERKPVTLVCGKPRVPAVKRSSASIHLHVGASFMGSSHPPHPVEPAALEPVQMGLGRRRPIPPEVGHLKARYAAECESPAIADERTATSREPA